MAGVSNMSQRTPLHLSAYDVHVSTNINMPRGISYSFAYSVEGYIRLHIQARSTLIGAVGLS